MLSCCESLTIQLPVTCAGQLQPSGDRQRCPVLGAVCNGVLLPTHVPHSVAHMQVVGIASA